MAPRVTGGGTLRVFMTADAVGGVWSYAIDLARGLAERRIETVLAVIGPSPGPDRIAALRAAVPGVTVVDTGLPLDWVATDPAEIDGAGLSLAAMAREARSDIIHLNSPAYAAQAHFQSPVVAVAHSCVATWWAAARSGALPDDFRWRADRTDAGYRRADAVIAPTRAFAQATARCYGLRAVPEVVHNGRREPALGGVPTEAPPTFAFTAGRLWDEGKNVSALDRVAARLPFPVVAAGSLIAPHGGETRLEHVRTLGELDQTELRGWLAAGPVFVSIARYEPFGLSVLEAAQAGCALVLSDIPTFRELWDGAALFVPLDDDDALAAALAELGLDPERRATLGQAARERARRYTVEAMTAGVCAVYDAVLGARARAGAAA